MKTALKHPLKETVRNQKMNQLQTNSKNNLFETLEYLASIDKQIGYKESVPFVHIPYELICQWEGHFVKDQSWFQEIWTEYQWKELKRFDEKFNKICDQIPDLDFSDVPEVFEHPLWIKMISLSNETITNLKTASIKG